MTTSTPYPRYFTTPVEMEWIQRNRMQGRVVSGILPDVEKRDTTPLTPEEIHIIFTSERFTAERHSISKTGTITAAKFWVPLICLYHGFRPNEICQLLTTDIKKEGGIHYFNISVYDENQRRVKQLKTAPSKRRVPINNALLDFGFLCFHAQQVASKETLLFPELRANKNGSKTNAVSQWFTRLRDRQIPELKGSLWGLWPDGTLPPYPL